MAYMEYSEKGQDKLSKMIPLKDLYNCPCERSLREWEDILTTSSGIRKDII